MTAQRYNTNNPVPSNALPDLNDNLQTVDEFVNNTSGTTKNRLGVPIPVLQVQVAERMDELTADATDAINTSTQKAAEAKASATAAAASADQANSIAGIIGTPAGAGVSGYSIKQAYGAATVGAKLNRHIDVEDFADSASAAGDWTSALNNAISYAITNGITHIYGGVTVYAISGTVKIQNAGSQGLNIFLRRLEINSAFPKGSFWSATSMIEIGDTSGNMTGINIFIGELCGGINNADGSIEHRANGIIPVEYGFSLSWLHVGTCTGCFTGIRTGKHKWPNASVEVSGDFWKDNYIGILFINGTEGQTPIVEGWKIRIKFMAANYWTGIWYQASGHYGQIYGSDWDFNGQYLEVYKLSDGTGLSSMVGQLGLVLTNGTKQLNFLCYYVDQGSTYIVCAGTTNVSVYNGTGTASWALGDTISCTTISGVAMKASAVSLAGDNGSKTNFFDVLHDFQNSAFAKLQIFAGYLSGIIGGSMFSSNFQFQNAFSGQTDRIRGFGVSNSGSTLALYNYALSELPFSNITNDFVNFEKKLYLKDHKIAGAEVFAIVPRSSGTYLSVMQLADTSTDKWADEGSTWHIEIQTNYFGGSASFDAYLKGTGNIAITTRKMINAAFKFRMITVLNSDQTAVTGIALQFRQEAQDYMNFSINMTRKI